LTEGGFAVEFVKKIIPLVPAGDDRLEACSAAEPFALMVLGDSMLPEFAEGEIIVIEPEGLAHDGSYVLAVHDGEHIFRQLVNRDGRWWLHPLNPEYPDAAIPDLSAVKGVVIQKQKPGSRRSRKSYID
jgi:SOS-response transcriptional repressor LexA